MNGERLGNYVFSGLFSFGTEVAVWIVVKREKRRSTRQHGQNDINFTKGGVGLLRASLETWWEIAPSLFPADFETEGKTRRTRKMKVLKAIGAGLVWVLKWVWNSAMEERRNKG